MLSSTQMSIDEIVDEFIDEDWIGENTNIEDNVNNDFIEPYQDHQNSQRKYKRFFFYKLFY